MSHEIESFWTIVSVNINPHIMSHDAWVNACPDQPNRHILVRVRRDLDDWKILFLIFSIKNALTVSFFKAVYIIKWRSRVHDAVMTPTQMISDFLFCITWTAEQLYFYFVLLCTHLYLMNGLGSDYLLSLLFQNSDDFFDAETSLTSGGARTRKNFEIKK